MLHFPKINEMLHKIHFNIIQIEYINELMYSIKKLNVIFVPIIEKKERIF